MPDNGSVDLTDPYGEPSWELECLSDEPNDPFRRYRSDDAEGWAGKGWSDGVRPSFIVENVDDIAWHLEHAEAERPILACCFCAGRYQHETKHRGSNRYDYLAKAFAWWRSHECEEGVRLEALWHELTREALEA